jgi:hypothetical protein
MVNLVLSVDSASFSLALSHQESVFCAAFNGGCLCGEVVEMTVTKRFGDSNRLGYDGTLSDDLVDFKLVGTTEGFFGWSVCVGFHERLALRPSLKVLFGSPVCHHDVVIAFHGTQDFSPDEARRL